MTDEQFNALKVGHYIRVPSLGNVIVRVAKISDDHYNLITTATLNARQRKQAGMGPNDWTHLALFPRECEPVARDARAYPHVCPGCGELAFVGFNLVDCIVECKP